MILRYDRVATELPPPSESDPAGAAAVQGLLGGRFGEMSTFLNYTFQSFNFRNRQGARPFYGLVANIAAEEVRPRRARLGHDQHHADRRDSGRWWPGTERFARGAQGDWESTAFPCWRPGRSPAGLQRPAVERRLRLLLRRPRRGSDAQLLSRDRS